ncbi:hypothetical protein [Phaeobacter sp. CECT 5382]|uniref:hypothetical protein n=1 Tax=Phaeobacter sp. CECT 5382 TaxID=1712645 RepID=UPI0012E38ED9|nr:hypothetical protein [Phaeobacter sp. CECT 5382]
MNSSLRVADPVSRIQDKFPIGNMRGNIILPIIAQLLQNPFANLGYFQNLGNFQRRGINRIFATTCLPTAQPLPTTGATDETGQMPGTATLQVPLESSLIATARIRR